MFGLTETKGPSPIPSASAPRCGGPKGAPPAIPPIIITPFQYPLRQPAIDPRALLPGPPVAPPPRPAISARAPARR